MSDKKIRKVIIRTHDKHLGSVRRAEVRVGDQWFYLAICSCGFCSTATSEVSMAAHAIETHLKSEVMIAVAKATS